MTKTEIERLAVLETKVDVMADDISEVKGDVKTLLGARNQMTGAGAFLVRLVPFVALGASVYAMLGGPK